MRDVSEAVVSRLQEQFLSAPFATRGWRSALAELAARTGSTQAQLLGLGGHRVRPFNHMSMLEGDEHTRYVEDFVALGAHRAAVNWRVAAGEAHPGQVVSEAHYARFRCDPRYAEYEEHLTRWNSPHGCQTTLLSEREHFFGFALLRTGSDGVTRRRDRALFAAAAPFALAAVRIQHALEHEGARLLAASLECVRASAFILDESGIVRATTASADDVIAAGNVLGCRHGRLSPVDPGHRQAFRAALALVLGGAGVRALVQRLWLAGSGRAGDGTLCEIFRLPREAHDFGFAPRALVVLRPPTSVDGPRRSVLAAAFGLTPTELEVAVALGDGMSRDAIARVRGISTATVITHIRAIFRKCDLSREAEITALVNRVLR